MAVNQGIDLQAAHDAVNACRTLFKKGFKETQEIRSYVLQKFILSRAEEVSAEHGFEWALRISSAQGSTGKLQPYQQVEYQRGDYDVSLKVTPATVVTHKNMWFDRLLNLVNKGAVNQIWKVYNMKASAAEEERAKMWESLLLNPPAVDGASNETLGLLYHFPRSMTSAGVFTEQLTPARNGVYYRDLAGTVSSLVYTKDRALAALARLRTLVCTHRGVMDDSLMSSLKDLVRELGVEYLDQLKGDKSTFDTCFLWDEVWQSQYEDFVKALGAPLKRDYYPTGDMSLRDVKTVAVPSFNNHFLRPIFLLNLAELKYRKERGNWEVQGEQQVGHNGMAYPVDSCGQLWAENPSVAGGLCHGTFTTGT